MGRRAFLYDPRAAAPPVVVAEEGETLWHIHATLVTRLPRGYDVGALLDAAGRMRAMRPAPAQLTRRREDPYAVAIEQSPLVLAVTSAAQPPEWREPPPAPLTPGRFYPQFELHGPPSVRHGRRRPCGPRTAR